MKKTSLVFIALLAWTRGVRADENPFSSSGGGGGSVGATLGGGTASKVVTTDSGGAIATPSALSFDGTSTLTVGDNSDSSKDGTLVLTKNADIANSDPVSLKFLGASGTSGNQLLWDDSEDGLSPQGALYFGLNANSPTPADGDLTIWNATGKKTFFMNQGNILGNFSANGLALGSSGSAASYILDVSTTVNNAATGFVKAQQISNTWTTNVNTAVGGGFNIDLMYRSTQSVSSGHGIAMLATVYGSSDTRNFMIGAEGVCRSSATQSGATCNGVVGHAILTQPGPSTIAATAAGGHFLSEMYQSDTVTPSTTGVNVTLLIDPTVGGGTGTRYGIFETANSTDQNFLGVTTVQRSSFVVTDSGGTNNLTLYDNASLAIIQTNTHSLGLVPVTGSVQIYAPNAATAHQINVANGGNVTESPVVGTPIYSFSGYASTKFIGADNATVVVSSISAVQASVTTADTYVSFNSNTGQEGSIAGTASAGVLAYNTFTGGHWTIVNAKVKDVPILTLLESTGQKIGKWGGVRQYVEETEEDEAIIGLRGNILREPDGKPRTRKVTVRRLKSLTIADKQQLVYSRPCKTRGSKAVLGFFGGRDNVGRDTALALGTGLAWVANKGQDVEPGDLLMASDVEGAVEVQVLDLGADPAKAEKDDVIRRRTVAKASEAIQWKPGEKRRKVAVRYTCG